MTNDVDTLNLCPSCGRLNQSGHVCPTSPDAPAAPPGFHPTAGFLRHPQDAVVTHPQDVRRDVADGVEGVRPVVDAGQLLAAMRATEAPPSYSVSPDQLPLPGMPAPKGAPPGVPLPPDWDASDLTRSDIARDVAEDMARTNAKAAEHGMEAVASTAGHILAQGAAYKERLLHQMLVNAFVAGASHGAATATSRAIEFGLNAAGARR